MFMGFNIKIVPRISSRKELVELVKIDRHCYRSDPPKIAFEWAKRFPWTYTLLQRLTDWGIQTVGYGVVLPVDNFVLEGLRGGGSW